jgi:hypothetical protein
MVETSNWWNVRQYSAKSSLCLISREKFSLFNFKLFISFLCQNCHILRLKPSFALSSGSSFRRSRVLAMEAVVVDYGSKLLKAGIASPDQDPPYVSYTSSLSSKLLFHFAEFSVCSEFWILFSKNATSSANCRGSCIHFSKLKNIFDAFGLLFSFCKKKKEKEKLIPLLCQLSAAKYSILWYLQKSVWN